MNTAYKVLIYFAVFAAVSVTAYALCGKKYRRFALLVPSVVCYAFFSRWAALFAAGTIITTYFAAVLIGNVGLKVSLTELPREEKKAAKKKIKSKKRLVFAVYIIINLGFLAVLKYFNFFAGSVCSALSLFGISVSAPVINAVMPLGISYYTLQAAGYVIDVLRGKYKADKSFFNVALFIIFFVQLNEGPFGRYDELMPQLSAGNKITSQNVFSGVAEILAGVFKLLVISNRAAIISSEVFSNPSEYSGLPVVMAVAAFTVQLYADFSGYINIARGIARLFGVELQKNFDMPFISQNVGEFWRRWHISLGSWFRDYVFYPVSTSAFLKKCSKKLKPRNAANLTVTASMLAVWFLTGLWHGASAKYVVYGLYYFVLMMINTFVSPLVISFAKKHGIDTSKKPFVVLRVIKTLVLVGIGMFMFKADNLTVFCSMFASVFKSGGFAVPAIEVLDLFVLLCAVALLAVYGILKLMGIDLKEKYDSLTSFKKYWVCFAIGIVTVIFGAYGLGYLPPDPIYGGF